MREIKFRAWHHGEMLTQAIDTPYGVSRLFGFLDANGEHSFDKVMQWTGLQDSKGVDIYEGDIVRYRCKSGSLSWDEPHPVVWRHTAFRFGNFGLGFNMPGVLEEHENQPFLTVIGNIYEDKELIK